MLRYDEDQYSIGAKTIAAENHSKSKSASSLLTFCSLNEMPQYNQKIIILVAYMTLLFAMCSRNSTSFRHNFDYRSTLDQLHKQKKTKSMLFDIVAEYL
jgi:hypothetical protein